MTSETCTAFAGHKLLARGAVADVAVAAKRAHEGGVDVLILDDADARSVELDLRGTEAEIRARLAPAPEEKRGRGRPRLGVTAREVTLLPRHWDWLASQPGGASVTLRKLVETALRAAEGPDRVRRSREAAYRFMTTVAGDLPAYEEATRMLFAGDWSEFERTIRDWPADVRDHALRLAEGGWRNGLSPTT